MTEILDDDEPFAVFDDPQGSDFSVGVEEEYFLVDRETGGLVDAADAVLDAARAPAGAAVDHELKRSQVESGSAVCEDLADLRRSIVALRRTLADGAASVGARLLASGTHPFATWGEDGGVTPEAAYLRLEDTYGMLTVEQSLCGCHVHVGVRDPELAIEVVNRVRPWLPTLVAATANSPYWMGQDTSYASYRTQVFSRWPTAGLPEHLADRAAYEAVVADLLAISAIDAPARIYWDVRPSVRYPTVEFRMADVQMTIDEAVTVGALVRALVQTCHDEAVAGIPAGSIRPELLRAAQWRAARHGLTEQLVDLRARELRPAGAVVEDLLAFVRPVLDARGEWETVLATTHVWSREGTGAERQRRSRPSAEGDLRAVVDHIAAATIAGT